MGKLSVLGAQRVKALESMLDDKMKAEIAEIKESRVPQSEATMMALREHGVEGLYHDMVAKAEEFNAMAEELHRKTGIYNKVKVKTDNYDRYSDYLDFRNLRDKFENGDVDERIAEIKAEYTRKKQMLWLCETLEEAKAIVGLEDDE